MEHYYVEDSLGRKTSLTELLWIFFVVSTLTCAGLAKAGETEFAAAMGVFAVVSCLAAALRSMCPPRV